MLQESILQYFQPSLSYHLSSRPLFCLFLSGRLRQVLMYLIGGIHNDYMGAQWLSGRMLDSRPKDRGFEPHRHHCVVLVQPRKTRPFITERLLMGCKESNQTNKHNDYSKGYMVKIQIEHVGYKIR